MTLSTAQCDASSETADTKTAFLELRHTLRHNDSPTSLSEAHAVSSASKHPDGSTSTTLEPQQSDTASPSDNLFSRLQEVNARLPPQDSTSFILAQIERQNTLLEKDPKSISLQSNELRAHFSTVQRLVTDNLSDTPLAAANLSPTADEDEIDWDFWEAVIQDFDRVAFKMPHLLSVKLHAGVPSRVRGLIWQTMSKASSLHLETVYGQLCQERSPHESIIQRDLARTFPYIDMFMQENGPGQQAMRRVLIAYSLYDAQVGYCQGLAFLVGPLLMHMPETQAFCVFVRLMETYEMRSMFTLSMEGLQLRLFQFSCLLKELLPELAQHLENHSIHPAMYASQWFLTLFAYAFPISLVKRIYDIVFAEGAAETIMRVAIAMLKRSQAQILEQVEFEDLLDYITSRKLCLPFANDSDVIRDATLLSGEITKPKMDALAEAYSRHGQQEKHRAEQVLSGRFGFFWRKRSVSLKKKTSVELRRSASSGMAVKKRWSSMSSHEFSGARKVSCTSPEEVDSRARASFSSLRGVASVGPTTRLSRPPTAPSPSNEGGDSTTAELFLQLQAKHQQALMELGELRMDKHEVESERDALKATVLELEKRYAEKHAEKKTGLARSRTTFDCQPSASGSWADFNSLTDVDSIGSGGCGDSYSDTTVATSAMEQQDQEGDKRASVGGEEDNEASIMRTELVRVKVENFELQQQVEKLGQELEDVQSRLDMVNEGQMALVDKLIVTKADMDELLKEKKRKDLEWVDAIQENAALKQEVACLNRKLARMAFRATTHASSESSTLEKVTMRRRSMDDHYDMPSKELCKVLERRVSELETSLAEAKMRLAEYEASQDLDPVAPWTQQLPPTPNSWQQYRQDTSDIKQRVSFDRGPYVNQDHDNPRTTSMDSHMSRSSSLYGRMWHAISPRYHSFASNSSIAKRSSLA